MQITGGFLKSRNIDSPKGENVRPTLSQIRESIFSTLFSMIDFEGKSFLDAFAGSGIMGFEAVSRGFANATFVEKDKKTCFLLKENIKKLDIEKISQTYLTDTTRFLKKTKCKFDIIYIDPPYKSGLYDEIVKAVKDNSILSKDGLMILEHPSDLKIDWQGFELLKQKIYADKTLSYLNFSN